MQPNDKAAIQIKPANETRGFIITFGEIFMRKLLGLGVVAMLAGGSSAVASSHREAPFITRNPKVDATDFYLFNSYESSRANFVTVIANYQPLQDAYGGPNYFSMDPEALYEIHFDNTGDGREDITFQFRFQNSLLGGTGVALGSPLPDGGTTPAVAIPLINAGPIGLSDGGFTIPGGGQGQLETYTVSVVQGNRRTGTNLGNLTNMAGGPNPTTFAKPLDNVGSKTFPGTTYASYSRRHVYDVTFPASFCTMPGKLFVGQRAEGFAVNLGPIFDLINAPGALITSQAADCSTVIPGLPAVNCRQVLNPVPATSVGPIGNKNVTTLALEVPASCLRQSPTQPVIGGWTTASVRQARVINPTATYTVPAREGGAWTQVSRLGMPLVNEVVIGVPDKDKFNASEPVNDVANFAPYVLTPTLPLLVRALFGVLPPKTNRVDLLTVFLTGYAETAANFPPSGLNINQFPAGAAAAEFVRLNTTVTAPFTPRPAAMQNNLGALGCFGGRTATTGRAITPASAGMASCDPSGFPNGRRPGDDVVDIALRVVEGILMSGDDAPGGDIPFHDGVLQDASQFDSIFPYLKAPNPGA